MDPANQKNNFHQRAYFTDRAMSVFKERAPRRVQSVTGQEQLGHLIKNYLVGREYLVKGIFNRIPVKVLNFHPPDTIEIETDYMVSDSLQMYRVFNKYMDVTCSMIETRGPQKYLMAVKMIQIATDARSEERLPARPDQVTINNIRAARNVINASLFNIPTSVQIHFKEYQKKMENLADEVHINVFDKKDEKLELVRKTQKSLYLRDTQDVASYIPDDEASFIDYRAHLSTDIERVMKNYKNAKVVSELVVPIIYIGHDGAPISLGYIQLISRSKAIETDLLMELKIKSFEMVDRIRDSNTMLINKRQPLFDASRKGLRLRIQDEELKKFLQHQKGFSFDIVFRLQQPITVSTEIVFTATSPENDHIIGVKINGYSSRPGEMERYFDLVAGLKGN